MTNDQIEASHHKAGDEHYTAFVGPPKKYDLVSAMQFNLFTALGLRQHHHFLDIGCGSLRAGKLFIPYLLPGRYFGIEPEQWLIDDGIENELGRDIVRIKHPTFDNNSSFQLSVFGQRFDYINAQSIFSHASAAQIRTCLSEAVKVMKPTTVFAATYMAGEENYDGDEWVYPGTVTYAPEYMALLVRESGLGYVPLDWPHPNRQTWFAATLPGGEALVRDISNVLTAVPLLKSRLMEVEKRLRKVESHPYVRIGLKVWEALRSRNK